jgi:hypothetical protein
MRGAAFTNKMMSKKSNQMKFRNRIQAQIMEERAKHAVDAYGGLANHGLDFGIDGHGTTKKKEIEGSFSGVAMQYAPKPDDLSEEDNYLMDGNDEMEKELKKIDEKVKSQEE